MNNQMIREKIESGLKTAAELFAMNQLDLAVEALENTLALAPDDEQQALVNCRLGEYLMKRSEYDRAVIHLENAIVKLFNHPESLDLFYTYRHIAWIYWRQGYLERATGFLDGAGSVLALRDKMEDAGSLLARASFHHISALLCGARGEQEQAVEHYRKEEGYLTKCGREDRLGPVYGNLCGILRQQGDYAAALEFQQRAIEVAQEHGDVISVGIGYNNLGEIYHNLGYGQRAEKYFEDYLEINGVLGNQIGNSFGLAGLGRIFLERGDFEKAEHALTRAMELAVELKSKSRQGVVSCDLALLELARGNYELALQRVDQAAESHRQSEQPESPWHRMVKARILFRMTGTDLGRIDETAAILQQVLSGTMAADDELNVSLPEVMMEARLLMAKVNLAKDLEITAAGQFQQARKLLDRLTEKIPPELRAGFLSKNPAKEVLELGQRLKA
jgi:tetratricopeptide (TPR) repeat protein